MNKPGTRHHPSPSGPLALGLALALPVLAAGCGDAATSGGDCSNGKKQPCVDLMNFSTLATNIVKSGDQPGAGTLVPPGTRGLRHTTVDPTQERRRASRPAGTGPPSTLSSAPSGRTPG
jgi:hypothetical protein